MTVALDLTETLIVVLPLFYDVTYHLWHMHV